MNDPDSIELDNGSKGSSRGPWKEIALHSCYVLYSVSKIYLLNRKRDGARNLYGGNLQNVLRTHERK